LLHEIATSGIATVSQIKLAVEAKLSKPMTPSTPYRMLVRHGWRKLAPGTRRGIIFLHRQV
jgi:hypothetical protein